MKILTFFFILLFSLSLAFGQANPLTAKTEPPVLLDKGGAGLNYALTEAEYLKLMKELATRPYYVEIGKKPEGLSGDARFGINIVVGGKNIGWILDGSEARGYDFYADWNADGRIDASERVRLKKTDGKYTHQFTETLTETRDGRPQQYRFDLKIEVAMIAPPGETTEKLAIKAYDATARGGRLSVAGRPVKFELVGTNGLYDTEYNNLYFDLNDDGRFDKTNYSAEKFKVPEKYVNIGDATFEFAVDRYGESLTLTPLAEPRPARVDLSPGRPVPDIAFTDLDGRPRRLADFRGRVVLLDFWGLWCAPCVAEAPNLAAFHRKMKKKGFDVVSFDKGDTPENLRKFIRRTGMNWTHSQLDEPLSKLYRIDRFPTYFLLDRDGIIASNSLRPGAELYKKVEEMLAAK